MMFMSTANHWKVHVCAGALPNLDLSCDVCVCVFRETAPHAFQLDLFFNNVSKPSTPVFDRLGRYSTHTHPPTHSTRQCTHFYKCQQSQLLSTNLTVVNFHLKIFLTFFPKALVLSLTLYVIYFSLAWSTMRINQLSSGPVER